MGGGRVLLLYLIYIGRGSGGGGVRGGGEELAAEGAEGAGLVGGGDEEGEVVVAAAVGDEADGDVGQGADDADAEAAVLPVEVAHDADDDEVAIDGDGAVALEVVYDFFEVLGVVDGDGDADLGGGDHVDGGVVVLEGLEDFAHEAGGEQHAAAFDPYGGDVVFGGNGFDDAAVGLV